MELKVWVDGIKRVVCGVTDNTTCQDIVIALAQAMGRTGRFTLIEKWRENERPLAPGECPLLVLQKWGEFAAEVKLVLYESGSRHKHRNSDKENDSKKQHDRFTHNFTPPVKTSEAVIKRSLTFSGGRKIENSYSKPEFGDYHRPGDNQGPFVVQGGLKRFAPLPEKVTSDGNSWSSNSSLSSQNSNMVPHPASQQPHSHHAQQRSRSTSHDRSGSGSQDHAAVSVHHQRSGSHDQQRPSPAPAYVNPPHYSHSNQAGQQTQHHHTAAPSHHHTGAPSHHHTGAPSHHHTEAPSHHHTGAPSHHHPGAPSQPLQSSSQHYPHHSHNQRQPSHPSTTHQHHPHESHQPKIMPPGHYTTNHPPPYHKPNHTSEPQSLPIQLQHPQHNKYDPSRTMNGPANKSPRTDSRQGPPSRPSSTTNNGPTTVHQSAFSVVHPRQPSPEDEPASLKLTSLDIPVYTDVRKSSHKSGINLEEYDLDVNFPDVIKETGREHLIEEYHMPGGHNGQGHGGYHGNQQKREEEERVKLLRLVTMQNERIKMQDSQLEIIDTEIGSREQKCEDLKQEIGRITEEISKLSRVSDDKNEEIDKLDTGSLYEEMESERKAEREIKNEITSLRTRLQKCEQDLHQFQNKVKMCSENLDKEHEVLKTDEKRRKEEEIKLQNEISELRKEVDERAKEGDTKTQQFDSIADELKAISEQLTSKTDELTSTEVELQRENLKFFMKPGQTEDGETSQENKVGNTNGQAIIKVLERSVTPRLKQRSLIASPLPIMHELELTKKKNGVWV